MTTRTWTRLIRVAAAAGMSMTLAASATAAPDSFAYVGQLTDTMGPVDDTLASVVISLWDAATDGNELWTQSWTDLEVSGGLFRIQVGMGSTPPLGPILLDRDDVWLQASVNGQALAPRQKLTTAGYAQVAQHARNLGGVAAADFLTETTLGSTPSRAGTAAQAPSNPAPGQLWYDGVAQSLFTWDAVDMEWEEVSTGNLEPDNLPPNGIGAVSNGVIDNQFTNVSHLWTTEADITDATNIADGDPAVAEITVNEAPGSYIYAIRVDTNYDLTSGNIVSMTLAPPAGTGVSPIVLVDSASQTFGPYPNIWTVQNMPALAQLLNTNPSGVWTLAVIDKDDNQAGQAVVGSLNSVELRYDIVRSDNLAATGLFETDDIVAGEVVGDTIITPANGEVTSNVRTTGEVFRGLQWTTYRTNWSSSGNIGGATMAFNKRRDDSTLKITYNANNVQQTSSNMYFEFRINGEPCRRPSNNAELRYWFTTNSSSNGWKSQANSWIAFCERAANIGDGTSIPAGQYTLQMYVSNSIYQGDGNSHTDSISIEEVF